MALYACPKCRRRVRSTTPKGRPEVYVDHDITRHSNIPCSNSRTPIPDDAVPLQPRGRTPLTEEGEIQLSGIRSTWDNGFCQLDHICNRPIMQDDRIQRRGDGWAHVTCVREEHQ